MKTISDEKTSMVSYNNEPQIKVVEALEEIQSEVRDIFTYLDSAAFILKSVFSSSIFSIFEKKYKNHRSSCAQPNTQWLFQNRVTGALMHHYYLTRVFKYFLSFFFEVYITLI